MGRCCLCTITYGTSDLYLHEIRLFVITSRASRHRAIHVLCSSKHVAQYVFDKNDWTLDFFENQLAKIFLSVRSLYPTAIRTPCSLPSKNVVHFFALRHGLYAFLLYNRARIWTCRAEKGRPICAVFAVDLQKCTVQRTKPHSLLS